MQKTALMLESVLLVVLLGMGVWQRNERTFKRWWKGWRAKPRRRDNCDHERRRIVRTAGWWKPSGDQNE